jgi:hypothetical protein
MLLSGRGTTRIKRGHRIWPNHTPRSMSIQGDTVLFGRMGSPNIYHRSRFLGMPTENCPIFNTFAKQEMR